MSGQTYEEIRRERVAASKAEGDRYRALSERQDREVNPGWWVIDSPEVGKAVAQASKKVQSHPAFEDLIERDDLETEAWMIVATRLAERAREITVAMEALGDAFQNAADNWGKFQHALEMDLFDVMRPIARRHGRTVTGFNPEDAVVETRRATRLFDISGNFRGGSEVAVG